MSSKSNQFCDCGERAVQRHGNSHICEFCYWCETQLGNGGEIKRRAEPMPKPAVKKFPAWHRMVEFVRESHFDKKFWQERNNPRDKFLELFRKHGALPDKLTEKKTK